MLAAMRTWGLNIRGWLAGRAIEHDALWTLNVRSNRTVHWGHQLHVFSGCFFCSLLAGPTSFLEISAAILLSTAFCRLYATWRLYPALLKQPITLISILIMVGMALGLLWTPDRRNGFDELDALRWAFIPAALWPIRHHWNLLVLFVVLGYLAANVCQGVQALAFAFGWESLDFDAYPNRISGWLIPSSGGSVLVAGLGLHLPAALSTRHPLRWVSRVLAVISIVAVIATGARGAWIAMCALTGVCVLIAAWRSRARGRFLAGILIVAAGIGLVSWLALGDQIRSRYVEGRDEIIAAFDQDKFNTSTGARLNMGAWALRAFEAHPIAGVGTGGYKAWSKAEQERRGIDPTTQPVYDHAHSAPLHIAATHGLLGLAVASLFLIIAFAGAWPRPSERGTYHEGVTMALAGIVLSGALDVIYFNTQTAAVLWTLVALSMRSSRPTDRPALADDRTRAES